MDELLAPFQSDYEEALTKLGEVDLDDIKAVQRALALANKALDRLEAAKQLARMRSQGRVVV